MYANLISPSLYGEYTNAVLGVEAAHEMGHDLLGVGDLPFKQYGANIMSLDSNPAWLSSKSNPLYSGSGSGISPALLFTPAQVSTLWKKCNKEYPNGNQPATTSEGRGGGGVPGFGEASGGFLDPGSWDEFELGPIESVTHTIGPA